MELSHATSDTNQTGSLCNTTTDTVNRETVDLPLEQMLLLDAGEPKAEYDLHPSPLSHLNTNEGMLLAESGARCVLRLRHLIFSQGEFH